MYRAIKIIAITVPLLYSAPLLSTTTPKPNAAQQTVFIQNHLQGIKQGSRIDYRFTNKTAGDTRYSDTVSITVTKSVTGGGVDLQFDFMSGPRHIDFSPAVGYTGGNPVIIHFLEHDIAQMVKATGGSGSYFRNRIRRSFNQPTAVRYLTISFQGETLNGTEVIVDPFVKDPNISLFGEYANKRYAFILSKQIPGNLYRIHTWIPNGQDNAPLIDNELMFQQLTIPQQQLGGDHDG